MTITEIELNKAKGISDMAITQIERLQSAFEANTAIFAQANTIIQDLRTLGVLIEERIAKEKTSIEPTEQKIK